MDLDPAPQAWTLETLDISLAADDELAKWFPRWDGAWSRQIREIAKRLGAKGVDLNEAWASTPQFWNCPCCQRYKPQLARLSPTSVLLCHLHRHHDHLYDLGKSILRGRNPRSEGAEGSAVIRAIDTCKGMIERFYPILICEDCNNADREAKSALAGIVDPSFSFSPKEIASFISPAPNQPHGINVEAAASAWKAARPEFDYLVAFVETLAKQIAQGHHCKSGGPDRWGARPTCGEILYSWVSANFGGLAPGRLATDLAERSIRRDGAGRPNPRSRRTIAPSDKDFAAYSDKQDSTSFWSQAPADWRCAACDRDRRQIMRKSNRGLWTGQLYRLCDYRLETDEEARWRRGVCDPDEMVFRSEERVFICGDCRHLITQVSTREPDLTPDCWSVDSLRELVAGAVANAMHNIDLGTAIETARANQRRNVAAANYRDHQLSALNVRDEIRVIQHRDRCTVEQALFTRSWNPGATAESNRAYEAELRWLLGEGERFAASYVRSSTVGGAEQTRQ